MVDLERGIFIRSPHLVMTKHGEDFLVYHSLFGNPTILNKQCTHVLNLFRQPINVVEIRARYTIEEFEKWLHFFLKSHFLIPEHYNERLYLGRLVKRAVNKICEGRELLSLGLILEERCNFDCSYCIAKKVIQSSSRNLPRARRMTWPVAKTAVDKFVTLAQKNHQKKIEVYFGGSEPMLNWGLLDRVINYRLDSYGSSLNFTFSTNTNASLITPARADYLSRHNVTVTTSLDGQPLVNDQIRHYPSGKGTFKPIIAGWDNLGKSNKKVTWFCLTLTDQNIDELNESFFDFLAARGIASCSFEPDIISPLKKPPEYVVEALLRFRSMGEKRKITVGGLWDKPLKNMFEHNIRKKLFNCSAFTGRGISVSPSGSIFPCSYSAFQLGTISELDTMFQSDSFRAFIASRAIGNIESCKGCEIEGQCMGGCYITSEYGTYTNSSAAFNYRCDIFKKATRSLLAMAINGSGSQINTGKGGDEDEEANNQGPRREKAP